MTFLDALKLKLHAEYADGKIFTTKDLNDFARSMRRARSAVSDSCDLLLIKGLIERIGDGRPLKMRVVRDKLDMLLATKLNRDSVPLKDSTF